MLHQTLTVITRIKPARLEALKRILEAVGREPERVFGRIENVHFARWILLDCAPGQQAPDDDELFLAFAVDGCDAGPEEGAPQRLLDTIVDGLLDNARDTLEDLYACCEGAPGPARPHALKAYLRQHLHDYTTRHVAFAYRGEPPRSLRLAVRLREEFDRSLDRFQDLDAPPPVAELRAEMRRRHSGLFAPELGAGLRVAETAAAQATLKYFLLYEGLTQLTLAKHAVGQRLRRFQGPILPPTRPRLPLRFDARAVAQDRPAQNPMVHLAAFDAKGLQRYPALGRMKVVNLRMWRYLVGLNLVTTIHCARWVLYKNARGAQRLLFLSNYDESWDGYIDAFIENDEINMFLREMWSLCEGFRDATTTEAFKDWIRERLLPTQVFYSAYTKPAATIAELQEALRLRELLRGPGGDEALAFYVRTGSCPPEPMLPSRGQVLGSMRALPPVERARSLMRGGRDVATGILRQVAELPRVVRADRRLAAFAAG